MSQNPKSRFGNSTLLATAAAVAALLVGPQGARAGALANAKHFSKGALIIPMQTSFQDACGVVSAYGLVYQVLAANYYLTNTLHVPAITVHWVYSPGKSSPNRCVPTNLHPTPQTQASCTAPFTGGTCLSTLPYQDLQWNDGCDFTVTNNLTSPVTLVDNVTGNDITTTPAGSFSTNDTTSDSGNVQAGGFVLSGRTQGLKTLSYPNYKALKIQHTATASTNVTAVQYLGGAFAIDAPDAPNFLALLSGATKANDFYGAPIDFLPFRTPITNGNYCQVTTSNGPTEFTTSMPNPNTNTFANTHWVNVHRAQTAFDAVDSQKMSDIPAKIALLITAGGVAGFGSAANGIKSDMLPAYLASAGLGNLKNAQGCPPTGFNATHATANCPNGARHGLIFDAFDVFDLADTDPVGLSDSLLNEKKSPAPPAGVNPFVYQNLWVPHWEGTTFPAGSTSDGSRACDNTCINKARNTISTVSLSPPPNVRKIGLLLECASIGVLEGVGDAAGPSGGWWYPTLPGSGNDPDGGYPDAGFASTPGQMQDAIITCGANADGGCVGKPQVRGLLHDYDPNGVINRNPLRNCTDPNLASGSSCVYYSAAGDPFAQVGDQLWFPRFGLLSDFKPYTNAAYLPEFSSLAFLIDKVDLTKLGNYQAARAQSLSDVFTKDVRAPTSPNGIPDQDPKDSSFNVYLGGHTYASDVSGTRVVLNTMLALGTSLNTIETGVASPTAYNGNVFVGTYQRVVPSDPNVGIPPEWISYNPNQGSSFHFPYHTGAVRGHPLTGTGAFAQGANDYRSSIAAVGGKNMDTDLSIPPISPVNRNIFTYVGGNVQANPSLGAGKQAPLGGLQAGWTPVDFDYDSVDPAKGCPDIFRIGEISNITKPTYPGPPYAGLLPAADGSPSPDGVCDLQEALEVTTVNLGSDHGTTNGVKGGSIPTAMLNDIDNARALVQLVRGFCYATSTHTDGTGTAVKHPAQPSDCNYYYNNKGKLQDNSAAMGGIVHSQPAIIPASTLVQDAPIGKHRPTVLYVGGLDGMLHAFYVPSDGLDTGYTGPAATLHNFNLSANDSSASTFTGHTPYNGAFAAPSQPLTELWAYIPPGQLPLLKSNNARVDSSPAVTDVFGDFGGTGLREWHTVLVASAGGSNREVFALDITNPLKPVLLWDLESNFENQPPFSLQFSPVRLANDDTGLNTNTLAQAFQWANGCHSADAGVCTPATFLLPPQADPGRSVSGVYNYYHLGASTSVSAAPMRRNNAPVFAAFMVTNEPQDQVNQGAGIYTFAIDLVTGQKLWEFNNPYNLNDDPLAQQNGLKGNEPPPGVTLFSKAGNAIIDTAYVGDIEGGLWEIDAADGINLTAYGSTLSGCTGPNCNFALSQAFGDGTKGPQPISTLSTIFIVPPNYPATGPLKSYVGQALLAYGTAGTDTISGLEPPNGDCSGGGCISGLLHLLPIAPSGRYSPTQVKLNNTLRTTAQQNGVAIEVPAYPLSLPVGERLFGSIIAAGANLFFSTNAGTGSQIDAYGNQTGASYAFDLSAAINGPAPFSQLANTNFGGAGATPLLIYDPGTKQASLVTVTDQKITYVTLPKTTALNGPSVNGVGTTPATFLGWFFRRRGSEY